MIQSVVSIQTAYAKALLVDRERPTEARRAGDVLGAHRVLVDACDADVRSLLGRHRAERGLSADRLEAFQAAHAERLAAERGTAGVESAYGHA